MTVKPTAGCCAAAVGFTSIGMRKTVTLGVWYPSVYTPLPRKKCTKFMHS
jgi:hypothetical protein